MEQTHTGKGHGDSVLVALCNDQIVTDGAAGLGDVLNAGGDAALDGVGEGEESVGAQGDGITRIQPCPLLFGGQRLRTDSKVILPNALGADILFVAIDVAVDDIVTAGTAQVCAEGIWQNYFTTRPEPLTAEEKRAWLDSRDAVALGSDAFFPFPDSVKRGVASGVKYIAQPGGSIRDDLVIEECNKNGIAMAFTGMRLFHH